MIVKINNVPVSRCENAVYALRLGVNAASRDLELIAPGFGDRGAHG